MIKQQTNGCQVGSVCLTCSLSSVPQHVIVPLLEPAAYILYVCETEMEMKYHTQPTRRSPSGKTVHFSFFPVFFLLTVKHFELYVSLLLL